MPYTLVAMGVVVVAAAATAWVDALGFGGEQFRGAGERARAGGSWRHRCLVAPLASHQERPGSRSLQQQQQPAMLWPPLSGVEAKNVTIRITTDGAFGDVHIAAGPSQRPNRLLHKHTC